MPQSAAGGALPTGALPYPAWAETCGEQAGALARSPTLTFLKIAAASQLDRLVPGAGGQEPPVGREDLR